jgi:hypothetical protein
LRQDRQAGVQRDTRQPPHPQREHPVLVFEPAEPALNGGALPVVQLEPLGSVRDQRVQLPALAGATFYLLTGLWHQGGMAFSGPYRARNFAVGK